MLELGEDLSIGFRLRPFILAIRIGIKKRAIAGFGNHRLRGNRRYDRGRTAITPRNLEVDIVCSSSAVDLWV